MRSNSLLSSISSEEDEISRSDSSTIGGGISTEVELQMRCTSLLRRISSVEDERSRSVVFQQLKESHEGRKNRLDNREENLFLSQGRLQRYRHQFCMLLEFIH